MAVVILISLLSFILLANHIDFSANVDRETVAPPHVHKHVSRSSVSSLPSDLSSHMMHHPATSPMTTMPPPASARLRTSPRSKREKRPRKLKHAPTPTSSLIPAATAQTPSHSSHNTSPHSDYAGSPSHAQHTQSHSATTRGGYSQLRDEPTGT